MNDIHLLDQTAKETVSTLLSNKVVIGSESKVKSFNFKGDATGGAYAPPTFNFGKIAQAEEKYTLVWLLHQHLKSIAITPGMNRVKTYTGRVQ